MMCFHEDIPWRMLWKKLCTKLKPLTLSSSFKLDWLVLFCMTNSGCFINNWIHRKACLSIRLSFLFLWTVSCCFISFLFWCLIFISGKRILCLVFKSTWHHCCFFWLSFSVNDEQWASRRDECYVSCLTLECLLGEWLWRSYLWCLDHRLSLQRFFCRNCLDFFSLMHPFTSSESNFFTSFSASFSALGPQVFTYDLFLSWQ